MFRRLLLALTVLVAASSAAQADSVRIMAAFTFKRSLDEVIHLYKANGGGDVTAIYGPTPALAKQIEGGAGADVFLSADPMWMKYVQDKGLIRPDSRVDLLATDLVLIMRRDNPYAAVDAAIGKTYPLTSIIGDGRIAMCDPGEHPAGRLARAALEGLGLWASVSAKIAIAESPPAAVKLVQRGEAPAGIVFATDANGIDGIKIAGVFPTSAHPPIVFPAALLRDSHNGDAARFFAFLKSAPAAAAFAQFGYARPTAN